MAAGITARNKILISLLVMSLLGVLFFGKKLWEAEQFNKALAQGATPNHPNFKFESRYAVAYAFAVGGRYHDAAQLFSQLLESPSTAKQRAAVHYSLGNIYFIRGLMVNRNGDTVKDEAEYLLNQARLAYQQSLRLDHRHWDARYNLDRVLLMLPGNATEGQEDKAGIVMGNIPTGLP